jgi:hypothetical protein
MARKDAITFWAGCGIFYFISTFPDLHIWAGSVYTAWLSIFAFLYFWLEAKNSMLMPLLLRFYNKIAAMEIENLEIYYTENIEARIRELMSTAKAQIDFRTLHNEYLSVRNNTILHVPLRLLSSSSTSRCPSRTTSTNERRTSSSKPRPTRP